jgi:glucosamine 6-phosphate synthetase-like amidotransferase/phosphosugar isomerase protein
LELSLASIEKAGHKHFMLKEVLEQPQVSFFFFLSIVSECDTSTIIFLFRKKRISNICLLSIFF